MPNEEEEALCRRPTSFPEDLRAVRDRDAADDHSPAGIRSAELRRRRLRHVGRRFTRRRYDLFVPRDDGLIQDNGGVKPGDTICWSAGCKSVSEPPHG